MFLRIHTGFATIASFFPYRLLHVCVRARARVSR
jgi:hypothetical protein